MCPTAAPAPHSATLHSATLDAAARATFRPAPAAPATPPCAVCGAPVPLGAAPAPRAHGPPPAPVCGAVCRQRLAALPAWQRCAACGRPLTVDEWAVGACADAACRDEHLVARPARARAAERAAAEAEAARRRDAAVAALGTGPGVPLGGLAPDRVPAVVVPGHDRRSFPLSVAPLDAGPPARVPRRRRRALAAHLRAVARLALADGGEGDGDAAPAPVSTPVSAPARPLGEPPAGADAELLGGACAACGGRCCRAGADRAYLTPDTLRRYFARHPGAGVRQAVAAYAGRVPKATVPGSCVYHGPEGCGLPRELRSDTCNRYFCEGLVELRAELGRRAAAGRPARAAYVAVAEGGRVTRGALALAAGGAAAGA